MFTALRINFWGIKLVVGNGHHRMRIIGTWGNLSGVVFYGRVGDGFLYEFVQEAEMIPFRK